LNVFWKTIQIRAQVTSFILEVLSMTNSMTKIILCWKRNSWVFMEYKRNGAAYRAHPNYNSFGEWYDWAMMRFESVEEIMMSKSMEKEVVLTIFMSRKDFLLLASTRSVYFSIVHYCMSTNIVLMAFWWKDGKKNMNWMAENYFLCCTVLVWFV